MTRFILVFATQYAHTDSEGSTTQLHCDNADVGVEGKWAADVKHNRAEVNLHNRNIFMFFSG